MRLFLAPGASSRAPHIALLEAGIDIDLVGVDPVSLVTSEGDDFTSLNPLGYVPLLQFDDGSTLREVPSILLFAADRIDETTLAPPDGKLERLRLLEWLSFLSSEVHQGFKMIGAQDPPTLASRARRRLEKRFAWINLQLVSRPFLLGDVYSVADIYLWVLSGWASPKRAGASVDLTGFDHILTWYDVVGQRAAVREALASEHALAASAE